MKINIWIEDCESNQLLENLGQCVCDNIGRALQMYENNCQSWEDKGYAAVLRYKTV